MSRHSPYVIELTDGERDELETVARRYTAPYRQVVRARIVLLAAEGRTNEEIAHQLGVPRQIVSKWRKRFYELRGDGLVDRPRSRGARKETPRSSV